MAAKIVYVVGRPIVPMEGNPANWEFNGVFSDEAIAVKIAIEKGGFVGPAELDKPFPDEVVEWPGGYYPRDILPKEGKLT